MAGIWSKPFSLLCCRQWRHVVWNWADRATSEQNNWLNLTGLLSTVCITTHWNQRFQDTPAESLFKCTKFIAVHEHKPRTELVWFTSAPWSTKYLTTSRWPISLAWKRGVRSFWKGIDEVDIHYWLESVRTSRTWSNQKSSAFTD